MIQDRSDVRGQQGDVHLAGSNQTGQFVGGGHHCEFVVVCGSAVFGIIHELDQSHCGRTLEAAYADNGVIRAFLQGFGRGLCFSSSHFF